MSRLIYIFMLFPIISYSQLYDDEPRIITFLKNYYSKPDKVENQYFIDFNYGLSFYDDIEDQRFRNHYTFEGSYGFFRSFGDEKFASILRFASEYAFLGNISSDFKTFENNSLGIETDSWRFGFGYSDGFAYDFGKNSKFYLIHSSDWVWTRMDIIGNRESFPHDLAKFDEKFKFGNKFRGGMKMQLYKGINLDFVYENTLIYPAHTVPKWLGMWVFDNLAQRWFDYFEPEWVDTFGNYYPWVRFIYKNLVSYILYEVRKDEMYWPFNSEKPVAFDSYKVGISFVFD